MTRSKAPALALFLAALMAAIPGAAQVDDSKTFFATGRELRAAGRCEEAIVQFRRALDINPQGLGSLRNIAECEEQLGQLASARRSYWDLRRAVRQTNETKYQGWRGRRGATSAAARVPRLTVRLSAASWSGSVTVDGKPLDPRWSAPSWSATSSHTWRELRRRLAGHPRIELASGAGDAGLRSRTHRATSPAGGAAGAREGSPLPPPGGLVAVGGAACGRVVTW